jgi:hypothetical protein
MTSVGFDFDLTAASLIEDPALSKFAGQVSDSGDGRWTINTAIDEQETRSQTAEMLRTQLPAPMRWMRMIECSETPCRVMPRCSLVRTTSKGRGESSIPC